MGALGLVEEATVGLEGEVAAVGAPAAQTSSRALVSWARPQTRWAPEGWGSPERKGEDWAGMEETAAWGGGAAEAVEAAATAI